MSGSSFVYVTYIRAPQQKVWDAFTKPEFQKATKSGRTSRKKASRAA